LLANTAWAPLSQRTNLKAPLVTVGAELKSAVLMAAGARLPSTCLGMMPYCPWVTRKGAYGVFVFTTNVYWSGAEMLATCCVKSPRRGEATAAYSGAKIRL